jgi:predicted membrane protein
MVMLALGGVVLVLAAVAMLWFRGQLARSIARVEQKLARAWPGFYPETLGRVYTSEKAWQDVFVPILGVAFLAVGLIWLWKGKET